MIKSQNLETIPLQPSFISFNSYPDLDYNVDLTNITETLSGICKKYNTSLEEVIPPLIDHLQNSPAKHVIYIIFS